MQVGIWASVMSRRYSQTDKCDSTMALVGLHATLTFACWLTSLYCSVTLLQACWHSTAGCPVFDALHSMGRYESPVFVQFQVADGQVGAS